MSPEVNSPALNNIEPLAQTQDTQEIIVEDELITSEVMALYVKNLSCSTEKKRRRCISAEVHKIMHS